jgi:xanthine dehydrogenase molybdopterin-binding subunit B
LAAYIDDLPLTEGTLHAAPLMSNVAHGRILSLHVSAVLAASIFHFGEATLAEARDALGKAGAPVRTV